METQNFNYYSLDNILKIGAQYNIIFGERSNGKTYACLKLAIENYLNRKGTTAYIRRYKEDFIGKRGSALFQGIVANDVVSELSQGIFDGVSYYAGKWYLSKYDEKLNKAIREPFPFCYGFALSDMEHDKSTSYPTITTAIFDEFISRNGYMFDEFVTFMNVISTIVRQRNDVKIFMLGNTVNQYCPYFEEFGLTHITEMTKGDIDVYRYGTNSALKVAVEYANSIAESKPSDLYFAFDNPKLEMIKNGSWELGMYPHLPYRFTDNEIIYTFFIVFKSSVVQCEIVNHGSDIFVYCHIKTTPIKFPETDLIYTMEFSPRPNYVNKIFQPPRKKITLNIARLFQQGKVFYQSNTVGEIVRNFIIQSEGTSIIEN